MSSKYLGDHFDIHTGGEDHISVHHTNEIAQSEATFGKKPWVNYWMHGAFLTFGGEKMSKSKGKIETISELEEKKYDPLVYRYFVLTGHYKRQLSFTFKNLDHAKNSYTRLKNKIAEMTHDKKENKKYLKEFENAINNDLDMPGALKILWKLVRDEKAEGKIQTIAKMDEILGLDLLKKEKGKIPEDVKKLVLEREFFRKEKDWAKADELREKIKKLGYQVSDSAKGPKIEKL